MADVDGDLPRLFQDSLIVWFRLIGLVVVASELSVRFTRDRDTRALGVDEDRLSGRLDGPAELACETLVLAAPQRRLVWYRL